MGPRRTCRSAAKATLQAPRPGGWGDGRSPGYFWKLGLFTSLRLLAMPKGSMLSVSRGEENASGSGGALAARGFRGAAGQHGQEVGQRQEAPGLEQLPLPGAAQRDGQLVLLGPVHVVAVGADLFLKSAVLGRELGLQRKQTTNRDAAGTPSRPLPIGPL